jgi:hypothetical protein
MMTVLITARPPPQIELSRFPLLPVSSERIFQSQGGVMRLFSATVSAVLVFLLFGQISQAAQVQTIQVDCSKNKTISDAVSNLDNSKAYVIEVTGNCTENVLVANYQGPSLEIIGMPSATLNGVDSTPPSSPLTISGARRVVFRNFTVNPTEELSPANPVGNISGINMALCEGCSLNSVIVNAKRLGVLVNQTQAVFFDVTVNVEAGQGMAVIQSSDVNIQNYEATGTGAQAFAGLSVTGGSRVRLFYDTPKTLRNFQSGIMVSNAASLEGPSFCGSFPLAVSNCLTIRDNAFGLRVSSAQVFQMGGVHFDSNGAGIWAENESVVQLMPPVKITNSTGVASPGRNGVTLTHNSHVSIFSFDTESGAPANVISNNFGRGIAVASGSTLQLNGAPGTNQITGNSATLDSKDLACDATSLVTGTATIGPGAVISCALFDPTSIPLP